MPIQKLNLRHKQIAYRLLVGVPQREIAREMKLSESHLSRVKHSAAFIQYISNLERHAEKKTSYAIEYLQEYAKDAVDQLVGILKSADSSNQDKRRAANDILRLGGYDRPPQPPVRSCGTITWEQRLRNTFGDPVRPVDIEDTDAEDQDEQN